MSNLINFVKFKHKLLNCNPYNYLQLFVDWDGNLIINTGDLNDETFNCDNLYMFWSGTTKHLFVNLKKLEVDLPAVKWVYYDYLKAIDMIDTLNNPKTYIHNDSEAKFYNITT